MRLDFWFSNSAANEAEGPTCWANVVSLNRGWCQWVGSGDGYGSWAAAISAP